MTYPRVSSKVCQHPTYKADFPVLNCLLYVAVLNDAAQNKTKPKKEKKGWEVGRELDDIPFTFIEVLFIPFSTFGTRMCQDI